MISTSFLILSAIAWYVAAMFAGDDLKLLVTRLFLCLLNLMCAGFVGTIWVIRRIAVGKDVAVNAMLADKKQTQT